MQFIHFVSHLFEERKLPDIMNNADLLVNIITDYRRLVAQMVKNLPAMQETQVQSLGWEDPLEKEMATNFSILVWRIRWTEEPGRLQSTGSQIVRHN